VSVWWLLVRVLGFRREMKSLGMLRRFALHKTDAKEKREFLPPAHLDELAQAAQVLPQTVPLKLKLSISR
jgi:hypothetical protein